MPPTVTGTESSADSESWLPVLKQLLWAASLEHPREVTTLPDHLQHLDPSTNLLDGTTGYIDSLMLVRFRRKLAKKFPELDLPPLFVFDHPSLGAIAAGLEKKMGDSKG